MERRTQQRFKHANEADFQQLSRPLIGSAGVADDEFRRIEQERFKTMFGVTPSLCTLAWNMIVSNLNVDDAINNEGDLFKHFYRLKPLHMLWALYYLKVYPRERQISSVVGRVCRNNFRKYTFFVIKQLADLKHEVVSGYNYDNDLMYYIDVVDTYFLCCFVHFRFFGLID